jgi:hypothetical protein
VDPDILKLLELIIPLMAVAMAIGMVGWFANTWLRIKHGYPLDGAWGRPVYPRSDQEVQERVRLLTSENAQLRAQLGALHDRLENIERIVTDQPSKLSREIEALAIDKGGNA